MSTVKLLRQKNDCYAKDIMLRNGFEIHQKMAECVQIYHKDGKKWRFDGWETAKDELNPKKRADNPNVKQVGTAGK